MTLQLQKFELGEIVMTAMLSTIVRENGLHEKMKELLERHVTGDWGDALCIADQDENDFSLKNGFRLLSAYKVKVNEDEIVVWLITESDRSVTTFLLPEEY